MPVDSYDSPVWSANVFFYLFGFVSLLLSLSPCVGQEVMNSLLAADVKKDCGSELLLLFDCYRNMAHRALRNVLRMFMPYLSLTIHFLDSCEIQAPSCTSSKLVWLNISINKHFLDIFSPSAWFYILFQMLKSRGAAPGSAPENKYRINDHMEFFFFRILP